MRDVAPARRGAVREIAEKLACRGVDLILWSEIRAAWHHALATGLIAQGGVADP